MINLAGRSVNCRYHPKNRKDIFESRIHSTELLSKAINACRQPSRCWLQMSTATIYKHTLTEPQDEEMGQLGGQEGLWSFSIRVAKAWEEAANHLDTSNTRTVFLRTAMVMSNDPASPFWVLSRLVRAGLGGRQSTGRQFVSWIHEGDFLRAIHWLLQRENLGGPVNLSAPNPIPNQSFMQELRRAYGRSLGIPSPGWLLELGARLLRTESELVLKSRRVVPGKLLKDGFQFRFANWQEAAQDLVSENESKDHLIHDT